MVVDRGADGLVFTKGAPVARLSAGQQGWTIWLPRPRPVPRADPPPPAPTRSGWSSPGWGSSLWPRPRCSRRSGQAVPYSEFKALVRSGQVAEVVVGETAIRGTLKKADGPDRLHDGPHRGHDAGRRPRGAAGEATAARW